MCGIIGYVGKKTAAPILLEGLRRLEYRGYDSAGVAVLHESNLLVRKKKGKIDEGLAPALANEPAAGQLGIGHTRWATHRPPTKTRIRTWINPAKSQSSTTVSSRISTGSKTSCSKPVINSDRVPIRKCSLI